LIHYPTYPNKTDLSSQREAYRTWLFDKLSWAFEIPLLARDFSQLTALGLLEYDTSRGYLDGTFVPDLLEPLANRFPELREDQEISSLTDRVYNFYHTNQSTGVPAVAACRLTPVGELIAKNALREDLDVDVTIT